MTHYTHYSMNLFALSKCMVQWTSTNVSLCHIIMAFIFLVTGTKLVQVQTLEPMYHRLLRDGRYVISKTSRPSSYHNSQGSTDQHEQTGLLSVTLIPFPCTFQYTRLRLRSWIFIATACMMVYPVCEIAGSSKLADPKRPLIAGYCSSSSVT